MTSRQPAPRQARAVRFYALLVRLYPAAYRREFGVQMRQTFADHYRDVVETDGRSGLRFWLGVVLDAGESLVKEHQLAAVERIRPMSKRAVIGWMVGLPVGAVVVGLLVLLARAPAGATTQQPMPGDSVGRALLDLALLVLTLALYAALVVAIVGYVRNLDVSGRSLGWLRLGLLLGAIMSLYAVVSNALGILLPGSHDGATQVVANALGSTLPPLFTGVVGLIGGYTGGTVHRGAVAGVVAGFMNLLANQLSWVLIVALAWPAILHGSLQSGVQADFYRYTQAVGHPLTLGSFLKLELFEDGIGFPIAVGLIALGLEAASATIGGVIGTSLRASDDRRGHAVRAVAFTVRSAGFLLTALALGLLEWVSAVEFNAVGGAHRLFGPSDVGMSLANHNSALWLIGMLVVLAFVAAVRPAAMRRGTPPGLASG